MRTPEGDITDIFAFLDPNDASQLVLIMNVNPFAVPAEAQLRVLAEYSLSIQDCQQRACRGGSGHSGGFHKCSHHLRLRPDRAGLWAGTTYHYGSSNAVLTASPTVSGCTGTTLPKAVCRSSPVCATIRSLPTSASSTAFSPTIKTSSATSPASRSARFRESGSLRSDQRR